MNINVPIDVVFGDGPLLNISLALEKWLDDHGLEVLGGTLVSAEFVGGARLKDHPRTQIA